MVAATDTMDSTKKNRCALVGACFIAAVVPGPVVGAEFGGGATVGVSWTDNVLLTTSPTEMDDIVYQVSPWIEMSHNSPGVDARLNYRYDWYRYSDLKADQSYHSGRAQVTGKAWQDELQVELGAARNQVLRDPDDKIPVGRLPFSGNLTDRDEYWVNPRLARNVGTAATLSMSYRYSRGQYKDSDVQDDTNQLARFNFNNYRYGRGLTWALRYDWRRTEYEVSAPWEHQQATAELGYWATSNTRVFAAGGKESAWDDPFDPSMVDTFWEAGFSHSAGEDLTAEFAAGERSFGSSWRGKLDYAFRRGSTSLSYAETPTTTGYDRSNRLPDFDASDGLDDFLNRPGGAERYLSQTLRWTLNLDFRRTGFGLSVFDEDRTGRVRPDGTPLGDESQVGARANLSWQAGARTKVVASGSIIDRDSDIVSRSRVIGAGLSANYEIGARSNLELSYSYAEQQPRDASSTSRDYVSNVVSLLFTITM